MKDRDWVLIGLLLLLWWKLPKGGASVSATYQDPVTGEWKPLPMEPLPPESDGF